MSDFIPKTVLITGASSGIGRSMAMALAAKDLDLILLARRKEKLEEIRLELLKIHPKKNVHLISSDVNAADVSEKITAVSGGRVDILINNAGLALGRERVETSDISDWDQMITTNVTSNFKMAHLVIPWMLKHGGGDIINLCSIAAHSTYPGGAVYCATKAAVHAFTKVLREETCGKNIRVMQISPGMVDTDFSTVRFRGDKKQADAVYAGMKPLIAEDISRMMMFMLDQPRHVVIDEIVTMPMAQGSPVTVVRNQA